MSTFTTDFDRLALLSAADAESILRNFDVLSDVEIASILGKVAKIRDAGVTVKNIPNWALWTQDQANTWYQTNVRDPFTTATTLAAMKAVIGTLITVVWAIVQIVLAMRDKIWQDLSNGTIKIP